MIRRWLEALFRRSRFERELREEMASHLDLRIDDLVDSGLTREQARRQARMEFGGLETYKEECRESRGLIGVDELLRNLRYAFRLLLKSPGFTLTAVLTLGLCIGANTAIFSVVDAVLFRPLPYPEPDRLGLVVTRYFDDTSTPESSISQSGGSWKALAGRGEGFDTAVFSGWPTGVNFAANGRSEFLQEQRVGAGFFRVLGVDPWAGREFTTDEDREGGPRVVVLGHALWQRLFGGNLSIVGQAVMLRGEPHTVVGIMPGGFHTGTQADLWTPLRPSLSGEGSGTNYAILARLHPGVSWPAAEGEMGSIGGEAVEALQLSETSRAQMGLVPLQQGFTEGLRSRLFLVWAAVGVVLLIGCINTAGLLLARSATRSREIATRMALGGGRLAILRQLLTESLMLAVLGGIAGAGIGYLGVLGVRMFAVDTLGIWQEVRLDGRVLLVTAALSLLTSVLFGLVPALQAARTDLRPALADGGSRGVVGGRSRWTRRLLVTAEVALGVVLLAGAGVLVRTLVHLNNLNPGFDGSNVTSASVSLLDARYESADAVQHLFDDGLRRLRTLPGVVDAGAGLTLPYERGLNLGVRIPDGASPEEYRTTTATYVTPGYLETLRIPLLQGRLLETTDRGDTAPVVVVNAAFARQHFSDRSALGGRISLSGAERQIVGIVGDVQQTPSWGDFGPLGEVPGVYLPASQLTGPFFSLVHTWFTPSWVVRTAAPQAGISRAIQQSVQAVDAELPVARFRTVDDLRASAVSEERFQAFLLSALALLALILAAVGIAGLIASSVTERTREMGLRLALGATHGQAIRIAAQPGVLLTLAGLALGILLARWTSALLQNLVHGVSANDLTTLVGVAGVLLLVATGASLLPALRIARLDPARTLRDE